MVSKSYILHDSIHTTFWKSRTEGRTDLWLLGAGSGEGLIAKGHTREFHGVMAMFLELMLVVDTHIYTYLKCTELGAKNQMPIS